MSENKFNWVHIFNALVFVMILVLAIVTISSAHQFKVMNFSYGKLESVEPITDGWVIYENDGTITEVTSFDKSIKSKDVTISRIFIFGPEARNNTLGFMVRNCAVEVFQDGSLVYQYGDPELAARGVLFGNYYCTVPLSAHPNEATEVDIHIVSSMNVGLDNIYFGTPENISARRFMGSLNTFGFAVAVFIVAFILLVIVILSKRQGEINFYYSYFLVFLLLVCSWSICDSQIFAVLGVPPTILCILSYESLMVMGIPFLMYIFYSFKRMRVFDIVAIGLMFLNFIMNNILHFSGVLNFVQTNISTQLLILTGSIMVFVQSIHEYVKEKGTKALSMIESFGILLVSVVVQLIYFYGVSPFEHLGFVQTGIILFVMIQVVAMMYSVFEYVKEGHKAEDYLSMAKTDSLTGLGNRRALDLYISEIANKNSGSYRVGCIVCDMNDLKLTNDLHGHAEGDKLLKDFANCLSDCFENRGVPFRTGGDEFYVMFSDVEVDMAAMMRRLEIGVEGTVPSGEYKISCSSGCYADYVPERNEAAVWDIIKMADAEMYKVKKSDRSRRTRI